MEKENLELELAVLLSTQAHTNAGINSSFPRQREPNSRRSGREKKSRSESKKSEDSSDFDSAPIPASFSSRDAQAANRSFSPAPASSGRNGHSNQASYHHAPFSSRDVQTSYPFFPPAPTSLGHNEDPNSAYYRQEMQPRYRTDVFDHYPIDQYTSRSSSSSKSPLSRQQAGTPWPSS
jgi:hypothetical protein